VIDLDIHVDEARPVPYAAVPQLAFCLRISEAGSSGPTPIQSVLLRCQLRIEPTRRHYESEDPHRLADLFGRPERWGQTMRSMLWTHAQAVVPAFTGSTVIELPVPCSYDFNVAATKYFAALEDGAVPLCLLFSGTIFYEDEGGALQVAPVSWERQCDYRLDVSLWREMMDHYYPNTAWLEVHKDLFRRLLDYRTRHGLPNWEMTLERLLAREEEQVLP
jgi:hypothetical protein